MKKLEKKKWVRPLLLILTRDNGALSVLIGCKTFLGVGPTRSYCQYCGVEDLSGDHPGFCDDGSFAGSHEGCPWGNGIIQCKCKEVGTS